MESPPTPGRLRLLFWLVIIALFAGGVALAARHAPTDAALGPVQRILYLHVPTAMNTFLASFIVFVAGIGYIWQRRAAWDDLAHAAAKAAFVFGSIVLLTGMIWAHSAWGHWWTWSPRLTFSLVLWLLYAVYLLMRPMIEPDHRRAQVCALYGIVAFLDVPLVYLSVKLLPDIHPSDVALSPAMRSTLFFWYLPVTLTCLGLIWEGCRLGARARAASDLATNRPEPIVRSFRKGTHA